MPNWTHNRIRVRGDNSEAIKEIRELFKGENPFNTLKPEPDWSVMPLTKEQRKAYSFADVRGELGELPIPADPTKEWDCPKFASTGKQDDRWYDWRNFNWGTKWPASRVKITQDYTDFLEITFDTAWSPPEPIAEILRSKYECNHVEDYHKGLYLSINWFYELEGEEGVGYLE